MILKPLDWTSYRDVWALMEGTMIPIARSRSASFMMCAVLWMKLEQVVELEYC